ncbi:hypothetical protein [Bacillus sp. X1(2014)]|uniref:hypothetical protein n=1 Tax=Bacillus sp. X1(2014) TaxID=1565991 RepID=UPI0021B317BF|nr:hypothetical protein [Bacillus sp. X1(2014)]
MWKNVKILRRFTTHFKGAKHLSLTELPLFSPILANMLQGGKADIDPYYAIETENKLILKFFDYELKGIGEFTPKETYRDLYLTKNFNFMFFQKKDILKMTAVHPIFKLI